MMFSYFNLPSNIYCSYVGITMLVCLKTQILLLCRDFQLHIQNLQELFNRFKRTGNKHGKYFKYCKIMQNYVKETVAT